MRIYPVAEDEMRHFLEASIIYELIMESYGETIDEELEAAAIEEDYSCFDQWVAALLAKRRPVEVYEDASS